MRVLATVLAAASLACVSAVTCRATDRSPLVESLRGNHCHQLDLEHGGHPGDLANLADVLPYATSLVEIELGGFRLTPADCDALASALILPRLEDIEAHASGIDDSCIAPLAKALSANPVLRELQLARNDLTSEGLGTLLVGLETNTHLRKLGLNGNALDDASAEYFADFFPAAPRTGLRSVALKGNALSPGAAESLAAAARAGGNVVRFDTRQQGGGSQGGRRRASQGQGGGSPGRSRSPPAAARATRHVAERTPEGFRLTLEQDAPAGLREAVRGVEAGVLPGGNPLSQWDESSTAEWVALLNPNFSRYRKAFIDGAVDFALLVDLEAPALEELGVTSATHRHRIVREARSLLQIVRRQSTAAHPVRGEL